MAVRSALVAFCVVLVGPVAADDGDVGRIVARHVQSLVPASGAGGAAVAVRTGGRTLFFNFGNADLARARPVTPDTLFNLGSAAKAFEALLLADAVGRGEMAFDDPAARHVVELQQGGEIRKVTLRQLASFTSGLLLPQDHPPWPEETFTTESYLATLNRWKPEKGRTIGGQVIHAQSGYILLRLALQRRFDLPYGALMRQRILDPLGLDSTSLPVPAADPRAHPRGRLPAGLSERAVQGYDEDGTPIGEPGDLQGYYHWLGTGQMYSSARDMAVFLAAQLGELPGPPRLLEAMQVTQRAVLPFGDRWLGAMAWERHLGEVEIVDRYGGLNNASATIALVPARRLGVVILCNRGSQNVGAAARAILLDLAAR